MYKLYIEDLNGNWKLADMGDDKPAMNCQVNDIAELKDRQASYSQALKIPMTKNNCAIFGFSDTFDVVTEFPYQKHNCRLLSNDYIIAGVGTFLIIDKVNQFFEVQILSGNADFFNQLSEKKMTELDLGYVVYGADGINNYSFANGDFYRYCLCTTVKGGYHYVSHIETESYPFVYLLNAFEQIMIQNGYTLESNIVEPVAGKYAVSLCSMNSNGEYFTEFNAQAGTHSVLNIQQDLDSPYYFPLPVSISGQGSLVAVPDTGCKYKARETGNVTIGIGIDAFTSTSKVGNVTVLAKNLTQDVEYILYNSLNSPFLFEVDKVIPVNKWDEIQVVLYAYTLDNNWSYQTGSDGDTGQPIMTDYPVTDWHIDLKCDVYFKDIDYPLVPVGGKLYLAGNIGFDTQLDFIKAVAQLFGFTFIIDNANKIVKANTMQLLTDNKPYAIDWSAKLHDVEHDKKFIVGSYAQNNFIRFEDNADDNVKDSGNFTVADESLAKWKDLFTTKFEAGMDNLASGNMVANIPLTKKVIHDNGTWDYEFIGAKPHIVILRNDVPNRYPPLPARWKATHYKAQQFVDDNYCTIYNSMLNSAKWIEVELWLTDEDIEKFDQFYPVYISKYGHYFYVNKIKNFVSGELTKCELVKL